MSYTHSFKATRSHEKQRLAFNLQFLAGDYTGFGGPGSNAITLIIVAVTSLLVPCVVDAPACILGLLNIEINNAIDNARLYGMQNFSWLRDEILEADHSNCSQNFPDPALVYLTASELSLSSTQPSSKTQSKSLSYLPAREHSNGGACPNVSQNKPNEIISDALGCRRPGHNI
jgi:hypothetical protein